MAAKTNRAFPKAELILVEDSKFNRQIISLLVDRKCSTFSMVTVTIPKLNKYHRTHVNEDGTRVQCPYINVLKITFDTAMTGAEYSNRVNNQLTREGKDANFTPQPHKWGQHFQGSKSILQKISDPNELYLICYPQYDATWHETIYVDQVTGEEIPVFELEDYMPEYKAPATQAAVENKVDNYRNPNLSSVALFKIDGQTLVRESLSKYINII